MDFRLQVKMIFLNDLMCAALCHAVRCGTVWHSDEIVLCTCCYSNVSSESSAHIQTNKREKKNTDTPWKCSNNNNLNNNESKFYFKEQKKNTKNVYKQTRTGCWMFSMFSMCRRFTIALHWETNGRSLNRNSFIGPPVKS